MGRRIHFLKEDTRFWDSLVTGQRKFEIRNNDRKYEVGELLFIDEIIPISDGSFKYTGRCYCVEIIGIYKCLPGLAPGYVILCFDRK